MQAHPMEVAVPRRMRRTITCAVRTMLNCDCRRCRAPPSQHLALLPWPRHKRSARVLPLWLHRTHACCSCVAMRDATVRCLLTHPHLLWRCGHPRRCTTCSTSCVRCAPAARMQPALCSHTPACHRVSCRHGTWRLPPAGMRCCRRHAACMRLLVVWLISLRANNAFNKVTMSPRLVPCLNRRSRQVSMWPHALLVVCRFQAARAWIVRTVQPSEASLSRFALS